MDLLDHLQQLLLDRYATARDQRRFREQVAAFQQDVGSLERARAHALSRLSLALQYWQGDQESKMTGTSDLAVLIRQVIRTYHRPLKIPRSLWQPIEHRAYLASLYRSQEEVDTVTVSAEAWRPAWLGDDTTQIDQLEQRRHYQEVVGDGMLAAMSDNEHLTYRSMGQKRAVDAALFAPPGATILVSMPTGGGKSLCFTLPAWVTSQAGRSPNGTTVVVTPTVSLAHDQHNKIRSYFGKAVTPDYKPHSLTGDTERDTRTTIYRGLEEGTLPLLFTSPESLLNGTLYEKVLEAARKGSLNWLVVDEAHIVDTWGAGFRTEFQLLAAYRRKLLQASGGKLRTLLLSATIAETTREMLIDLFAEDNTLLEINANQLRPEIGYWFATTASEGERQERILDALYHLPRPAILYMTQPAQTQQWTKFLHENGFRRLAAYSGETKDQERRAILREWNRNELDLIIATSAFGLGVDKEDIRTVLHASLPENINRFYQEVGRGGRDGCSAVSVMVTVAPADLELARSMFRSARISPQKAWKRWRAMWQQPEGNIGRGDQRLVDLNAIPDYNLALEPSDTHRNWNEHVLLLMQRAGLIKILDTQPEPTKRTQTEEDAEGEGAPIRRWLHVHVLQPEAVDNQREFKRLLKPVRDWEQKQIVVGLKQMNKVVQEFSRSPHPQSNNCLAYTLADIYPHAALACGGCPDCRRRGLRPYQNPISVEASRLDPNEIEQPPLIYQAAQAPFLQQNTNVVWDGPHLPTAKVISLLQTLVSVGFSQIIVADELATEASRDLVLLLADYPRKKHRVLTERLLTRSNQESWPLYPVPTAIVYPTDSGRADRLYQRVGGTTSIESCISIIARSLWLPSEHGLFTDRVNGIQLSIEALERRLKRLRDTL